MTSRTPSLIGIVVSLRKHYGQPPAPPTADDFERVLWENVAYLASPARRLESFRLLRESVSLSRQHVFSANSGELGAGARKASWNLQH